MPTEDAVAAALAEALASLAITLGMVPAERKHARHPDRHALDFHYLEMHDGDLQLTFYFAAHLNEIQPGVAIQTPGGAERFSLDGVQQWLGEPTQAYMFDIDNLDAACRRVADFTQRLILRYRHDPAAALHGIQAIDDARADAFRIGEIRKHAEAAWAGRDFAETERLYAGIAGHLTAAESKRLTFARKKQG